MGPRSARWALRGSSTYPAQSSLGTAAGPTGRQRVGVGAGRVTGPSEAAASAEVRGGGHGAAAVSRAVSVGEGVGRGPADINIPGGQARPVICPDLEHDVRSQGTGARPAPTVSPTGEALGVGAHLGAGWPSGLGAPVPVERPAAPTLPTPRDVDGSGGALGKATLASTTTPAPGRSPNNTWPRRTGGTASQGQVSSQMGPGLPRNPGRSGAGPRPTQTLEAQGAQTSPGPRCTQETAGGGHDPTPSSLSSLTL